jgi:hypothetical protein
MNYLTDYTNKKQTELFNKTGAFFAFSDKQFYEQKQAGVKYKSLGFGLICPADKCKEVLDSLEQITKDGIALDLKDNGKEKIIKRELYNYEAFYTGNIEEVADTLQGYGITRAEVWNVYVTELPSVEL